MSKYKVHQVANIPNYNYKQKYGFMVSQPKNYFATASVINIGMILFYVFSTNPNYWYLIVLTAIAHASTMIWMFLLAVIDPGIIPKIFSNFEHPGFRKIPISRDYLDGSIG
jgi:hypothetical protein